MAGAKKSPLADSAVQGAHGSNAQAQPSPDHGGAQTPATDASRGALIAAYIDAGLALVPIPRGQQGPTAKGWNQRGNCITTLEQAARLNGNCNVGLAHTFSTPNPTCALDLDNLDLARPWLAERGIDVDALLAAPGAVRIDSQREGRAKLLYRLSEPLASQKPEHSGLELRCGTKENGKTVQDVLPPSIHPKTGKPYRLVGDIAKIPPIPEPLLELWRSLGATKPRTKRLEQVQADDSILRTLNELGMVRSDQGGGKYWIQCPFEGEHTAFTGDGETVYYLPHTGGYIQGHFHCLHAHCESRSDNEFATAILALYTRNTGRPAPFAVDVPAPPVTKKTDTELSWLITNAPPVFRAYLDWYMTNAIRPHPVFALVSALLFVQALVGRSVTLPRGTRPNLWLLLLAPTESGKGDVPRLATNALEQVRAAKIFPAIPSFDEAFGSAEGLWWHLEQVPQTLWFDEELAKTLAAVIAAPEGSPRYSMRRALLILYDAAARALVPPIRYSRRTTSGREMQPLHHPFVSVMGTGVPRDLASFVAAAADDGLLNRFLVVVVEDLPAVGSIKPTTPLPGEVLEWARGLHRTGVLEVMAQATKGAKKLPVYSGLDAHWTAAMEYGSTLAQDLPGVWGRYAEKVLKIATLYAVADPGAAMLTGVPKVTPGGFEWARRFVHWANDDFARHFAAEGGGAENETDALARAFMATFDVPSLAGRDSLPSKLFAQYAGRVWRKCHDSLKRRRVIESLIEDGRIEEVPLPPKGFAYRRLG